MESLDAVILTIFIISIVIVFIVREVVCWYFKINKMIKIQQSILETLLKTYEQQGGEVNWEAASSTIDKKIVYKD